MLLDDFNEILCGNDKLRGRLINFNRALEFKTCLDDCNFLDLGFSRPKFTWSNLRQVTDLILEHIDRCFANPSWRILFPKASVTHLPRVFFDYCPVLLELTRPSPILAKKPFRFHTMWIHHWEFPDVVRTAWESEPNLHSAIKKKFCGQS